MVKQDLYHALKTIAALLVPAVLGLVLFVWGPGRAWEEHLGLAGLFQWRGAITAPREPLLVIIDSNTGGQLGLADKPLYWPRSVYAQALQPLHDAGARVVVFDIFFKTAKGAEDEILAQTMAGLDNVLLFAYLDRQRPLATADGGVVALREQLQLPLPLLADSALATAPFFLPKTPIRVNQVETFRDSAGDQATLPVAALHRWLVDDYITLRNLVIEAQPQLARELPPATRYLQREQFAATLRKLHSVLMRNPTLFRQLQSSLSDGGAGLSALLAVHEAPAYRYLNLYGPPGHLDRINFADLAQGDVDPRRLKDRAVFIGFAESWQPDQVDTFYTVYAGGDGSEHSGVEIAATAFANLLHQQSVQPLSPWLTLILLLVSGLVFSLLTWRLSPRVSGVVSLLMVAGYAVAAYTLFARSYLWLPWVVPLLIQLPLALLIGWYKHHGDVNRQRARISAAFGYYLPEDAVQRLLSAASPTALESRAMFGVCLASDGEQYTALAEQKTPQELASYINAYYEKLFAPVRAGGGIISDVEGDAMMALWTHMTRDCALSHKACAAALAIQKNLAEAGSKAMPTRIGLHAGEIALGAIGALDHFEYRAVGDMVNTASRIQNLNKRLGTRILVSGRVVEDVNEFFFRSLGRFQLAGKQQVIDIYELVDYYTAMSDEREYLYRYFDDGIKLVQKHAFDEALPLFQHFLSLSPGDGPANFYREFCEKMRGDAGGELWQGVFVLGKT